MGKISRDLKTDKKNYQNNYQRQSQVVSFENDHQTSTDSIVKAKENRRTKISI